MEKGNLLLFMYASKREWQKDRGKKLKKILGKGYSG